jgi:two-component system, OmpR family, sensor histidine kinase BaeS
MIGAARIRRSLTAKVLAGQLAVIAAGSATLLLVAVTLGPVLFHRHIREALGFVPATVSHHLDEAFAESLATSLAVAVTAATVTAAVVSWLVSTRIVRPVRALATAARRVSRGEYGARVEATGDDEVTALARAFNDMSDALASTEARRRALLSDVAHELRTPLATIDAHLEALADGVMGPQPMTWRVLRDQTARLRRLSEDVARVSSAEEHRLDLRPQPVAPLELLRSAADAAAAAFDAKGVRLRVAQQPDPPPVEVDPDRLREVLAILLDNALRHTDPGGEVTLSAERAGADVVLTVADTGEGLEAEQLERIFERFYRVDPSRSRDRGGSGIGLTIGRAIAEAHGGRLWAESPGPGRGTRLRLKLPQART